MKRRRLFWQLATSSIVVVATVLFSLFGYAEHLVREFCIQLLANDLRADLLLLEEPAAKLLAAGDADGLQALARTHGERIGRRITVILPGGRVVADTEQDPALMENHAGREEVAEALRTGLGQSLRHSYTVNKDMLYVALRMRSTRWGGDAVLRAAVSLVVVDAMLADTSARLTGAGVALIVLGLIASLWFARRLSRPLEEMTEAAQRFARGELHRRVAVGDSHETTALAEALNQMAADLDQRMRRVAEQRDQLEAVLSSMSEGVMAIDPDERVTLLNRAAAALFDVNPQEVLGRTIQAVVRNPGLQRFVAEALTKGAPAEADLVLRDGELHLQAHATPLGSATERHGILVVLSDVTRLRRLEAVRRDFVANVSHELKTPVTSIKGFVEALLDDSPEDPEEVQRFLGIVARQAERLETIIEDLLTLSRLDREDALAGVERRRTALAPVLHRAVQDCAVQATERDVRVIVECAAIEVEVSEALLEQAVANLIDNAVKYSHPGGEVTVRAVASETEVQIAVQDHGCGIPAEHLPRLFERFYRVDEARSRELGGTGLGLSIVKHIARAHGGRVTVESRVGEGSTFTLHLPLP